MTSTVHQLKYCECCGSLGLRPQGVAATYCRACQDVLARFTTLVPPGSTIQQAYPVPTPLLADAGAGEGAAGAGRQV